MELAATREVDWVQGKSSAPRLVSGWCRAGEGSVAASGEGLPGREMLPASRPCQLPAGPLSVLWRPLPARLGPAAPFSLADSPRFPQPEQHWCWEVPAERRLVDEAGCPLALALPALLEQLWSSGHILWGWGGGLS